MLYYIYIYIYINGCRTPSPKDVSFNVYKIYIIFYSPAASTTFSGHRLNGPARRAAGGRAGISCYRLPAKKRLARRVGTDGSGDDGTGGGGGIGVDGNPHTASVSGTSDPRERK